MSNSQIKEIVVPPDNPDLILKSPKGLFKVFSGHILQKFDVYLSNEIESEIAYYTDLIHFFNGVDPASAVYIHLSNYGGDANVGYALARAIKDCAGWTIVRVNSNCYSMAAILALAGDYLVMAPKSFLMFHNYSGGTRGKGHEISTSVVADTKYFAEIFPYIVEPFLTKQEVSRILTDRDVYIHESDKDLTERMKRHFPDRAKLKMFL